MAIPGIQEIQKLATSYSKEQLRRMAQRGLIDPTKAVMAGMMIDRIQKQNMQPPPQTVADEVLGTAPAPQPMPQQAGMTALPSGLPEEMAGGGIVAFADGGDIDDYADGGVVGYAKGDLVDFRNDPERFVSPATQRERDRLSIPYLMDDLNYARRTGDPKLIAAAERQVRQRVGPKADLGGLYALFPSAAAGELDRMGMDRSTRTGYVEDPLLRGAEMRGGEKSPVREIPSVAPPPAPAPKPEAKKQEPKKFDVQPAEEKPAEKPVAEQEIKEPEQFAAEQLEVPAKPEFSEQYGKVREAYKEAGVNVDLYNDLRKQLKDKKVSVGERRNAALGHAMMAFGFEMLGARRGQEFARMSQAGQKALYQYMGSMDKIAENEERLEALDRQVQLAEQQFKMTGADSAMRRMEKLEDQRTAIIGKNAELAQDANKVRAQVGADIYRTNKTFQANMQASAARIAVALGANRGGFTDKQLVDLRAQVEMQYGPALREKYKDRGSKDQIEAIVQRELDQKVLDEVGKARNIRQSGNIPVPSSGGWSVQGGMD
jgi:hypothetical protein